MVRIGIPQVPGLVYDSYIVKLILDIVFEVPG